MNDNLPAVAQMVAEAPLKRRVEALERCLQLILRGLKAGHVKSIPLLPEIDEDTETVQIMSLEKIITNVLNKGTDHES